VKDQGLVEYAAFPAEPTVLVGVLVLVIADGETDSTTVKRILSGLSEALLGDFHVLKHYNSGAFMPSLALIKEDLKPRGLTPALDEFLNLAFMGRVRKAFKVYNRWLFEIHFIRWFGCTWFEYCVFNRNCLSGLKELERIGI